MVYGEFKIRDRKCRICQKDYKSPQEKQTDVNRALRLFEMAIQDRYDEAIISGDTDLLPAIKAVQKTFPSQQVGVVIPIGRASEDLKKQTDFHYRMKVKHLVSRRYPDVLTVADGSTLTRPLSWT